jgi:hypothetical protein
LCAQWSGQLRFLGLLVPSQNCPLAQHRETAPSPWQGEGNVEADANFGLSERLASLTLSILIASMQECIFRASGLLNKQIVQLFVYIGSDIDP